MTSQPGTVNRISTSIGKIKAKQQVSANVKFQFQCDTHKSRSIISFQNFKFSRLIEYVKCMTSLDILNQSVMTVSLTLEHDEDPDFVREYWVDDYEYGYDYASGQNNRIRIMPGNVG